MKKLIVILVCLVAIVTFSPRASLADNYAISLVMDVSGSIVAADFLLQKQGYANAIGSLIPTDGTIALSVIEFGANNNMPISWTVIDSDATKAAFVASVLGLSRAGIDQNATNISGAITAANLSFASLTGYDYYIIDVSTDGAHNTGGITPLTAAQNAVAGTADVVNALGVGTLTAPNFAWGMNYDGSPAFSLLTPNFAAFQAALNEKFIREIPTTVPEPTTMLLLGSGLVALWGFRRKLRK